MTPKTSNVDTLRWRDGALQLLDQRVLPHTIEYIVCRSAADVADAITAMVVRGAPAIGIAAAYGVVLAAGDAFERHGERWRDAIRDDIERLRRSRPTAVNLAFELDAIVRRFAAIEGDPGPELLAYANALKARDVTDNERMGAFGAAHIAPGSRVLTHCNAGALATAGYGTALGVIRSAWRAANVSRVYATETRPWFQGARLTAWELHQDGIPVTLIADSAAAHLMRSGGVDWVITGADRIAANGDVANKIGTYSLAVNARAHDVRFMVAAPLSTIDRDTAEGSRIPIEERDPDELRSFRGHAIAPAGVDAFNPVFDVTPAAFIDVLVTEKGALTKPDAAAIATLFERR